MKWAYSIFILIVLAAALIANNKHVRIKAMMRDFQIATNNPMREKHIARGLQIMNSALLPDVMNNYRDERDVQFTAAMIGACQDAKANRFLWETTRNNPPATQLRIISMASLLTRDQFDVWAELTQEDIDMIVLSMPVHVVHWRQILLKYSGRTKRFLRRDTFPERHKLRALFKECQERYKADETQRMLNEQKRKLSKLSCPALSPLVTMQYCLETHITSKRAYAQI